VLRETQDIGRAKETVADALGARTAPLTEALETIALKPPRQGITVRLVALAWAPCWRDRAGAVTPAWE
jgi:hypothetical protein